MCSTLESQRRLVALGSFRRLLVFSLPFVAVSFLPGCRNIPTRAQVILRPAAAVLPPGGTVQFTAFSATLAANPIWLVDGIVGGSSTLGTISSEGLYTAPDVASAPASVQITVTDSTGGVDCVPAPVTLFQPEKFASGTVSTTNNPLVAEYSITAPSGASVQIQFGPDTNYGLTTWSQAGPRWGGDVLILVAGMRASTAYHMRALIQLPNGDSVADSDHTFITGALPPNVVPDVATQNFGSAAPAPGIELLSLTPNPNNSSQLSAVATDLSGNVIWYYPLEPGLWTFPIKLLANGHMLMVVAPLINALGQISPSALGANEVREIDLAGNIISRITMPIVANLLTRIESEIQPYQWYSFHHDALRLANGHYILVANYISTPGQPTILDALIDWNPEKGPVWFWSTADHLDVTRAPYGTADPTHANAVIYSPDDGNLILSLRNQNWILKIDYENGHGDGSVLWRLGPEGDFSLPPGYAASEWNYGQHYPALVGTKSMGEFPLMFFNNGNQRPLGPNGQLCGTTGAPQCYSSVPIFQLNEGSKTVDAVVSEYNLPAFSACCGNASLLSNQDVEFDVALDVTQPGISYIEEITPGPSAQLVWQMTIKGQLAYRGIRMPSLYPGVSWTSPSPNMSVAQAKEANPR